jgi:hypothetical protein
MVKYFEKDASREFVIQLEHGRFRNIRRKYSIV